MEQRDQCVGRTAPFLGHFGEDVPHHVLQANAGEDAVDAHGPRTLLVLDRVGLDKELTHAGLLVVGVVSPSTLN